MISDKEIKKTVKECLDDPEHCEMFNNLFSEIVKLEKKRKDELYGKCEVCGKDFPKEHLKFLKMRWVCVFCLEKEQEAL